MILCTNCGAEFAPVSSLTDNREICSNCGAELKEVVKTGQVREFLKSLTFAGVEYAKQGDLFLVGKVGSTGTKIDFKNGSIQELGTQYIYENTQVRRL